MKYIKKYNELSYSVNESGIPRGETQEIESIIKSFLIDLFENEKEQRFFVSVSGNKSKYGTMIDISFSSDNSIEYDESDMERMSRWVINLSDINYLISDYFHREVILCEFEFFDKRAIGKKDGRTLQVEDVTPQFEMALENFIDLQIACQNFTSNKTRPINLKFLVK